MQFPEGLEDIPSRPVVIESPKKNTKETNSCVFNKSSEENRLIKQ